MILLLRADGRLLFVRRAAGTPRAGFWSPPSGRIEPGETPEQAVRREAREELGIEVEPLSEVWQSRTDDDRFLLRWWLARAPDDDPRISSAEVAELIWILPEELVTLSPHFAEHRKVLAEIRARLLPP